MDYMQDESKVEDLVVARCLKARARGFVIYNSALYKCGMCDSFLKCISKEEAAELMHDIHPWLCGSHFT